VKNFAKTYVIVLTINNLLTEVINLILEKKIGSVIVVDQEKKPIGIITTRDLLQFFIQKKGAEGKPKKSTLQFGGFFNRKK